MSGLILSGYGLGGSIFSIYYNKRVDALGENPKLDKSDGQMYFPEVVGQRYPRIHKEVCIGMVIFTLLAVVLLSNYQPKKVDVVQEDSSYLKNSFIDMSPAKRERLGILLQDDDFEYIKRNMSRSVLTRTDHEKSNDLLGVINEEEFDSEREVSDYVDQIERNLDLEIRAEQEISIFKIMRSQKFILIYCMSVFQMMYPLYFDVVFKEIGQFYIKEDETLTFIGSVSFITNSLLKLIIGIVLEVVPARRLNFCILVVMILHVFTL